MSEEAVESVESVESAELLAWDSGFFGVRIARVAGAKLDAEKAGVLEKWCADRGVGCLYFFADIHDPATTRAAEHHGYSLVDVRVTYERRVDRSIDNPPGVRAARAEEGERLEDLARGAFRESRFGFDANFPVERVDELYVRWVRRGMEAMSGGGGGVLVVDDGAGIAGYVVCTFGTSGGDGGGEGGISLIGVDANGRGKGVGSRLVAGALSVFSGAGLARASVVTQARNIGAQRLYQRAGFVMRSSELVYHRWFGKDRGRAERLNFGSQ